MKIIVTLIPLILVGGFLTFSSAFYTITEGQQAIITQFGKPIGDPIIKAGYHFKKPFVQKVKYVDKRILSWDGYPNQIPTKDKKYISVDTTARWRITNALKFIQSVQDEQQAKARLDSILDANTRDIISKHNLVEAVRNTNGIIKDVATYKAEQKKNASSVEEEISGEIEKVEFGRELLSKQIAEKSADELKEFGIEIIDVQFRRISYEKSVEQKVYERMVSERLRIAEKIRAIGKGEKAKIEGRLSRDLQTIQSLAYRNAQLIKGKGEAKSYLIYAKALSKDPSFYEFIKTMESYKTSLNPDTKLILSNKTQFLKYLKSNQ
ncbi:MAG: membrane protease subunit HflC [Thermoproteota archaeon]|jgi:membrane protease subunit HflC